MWFRTAKTCIHAIQHGTFDGASTVIHWLSTTLLASHERDRARNSRERLRARLEGTPPSSMFKA